MQGGYVSTSIEGGIATVEFFHPAHNSLPGYLLSELAENIRQMGDNKEVRVILLRSKGNRTYCAGASFDELMAIKSEGEGKNFFMGFARVINACRTCGKIVVGRVQGKAVGGGVGLASAVDYCMATQYASIKLSELAIGIGPFVVGPAVERKVGLAAFSQLTLNPEEWQTAQWGKERGLFQEVFQTTEQLDAYIDHFISKIKGYNPDALSALKNILWTGTDHWDDLLEQRAAVSGRLVLSEFTRNALNKIKSRK